MRLTHFEDVGTIHQSGEFTLRPGITLQIRALSPDYDDILADELPSPEPPRLGIEKEKGQPVIGQDGRPLIRYGEHDPKFKKEARRIAKLGLVKMILDGLEPGQIQFDADKDPDNPAAFYSMALKELTAFGFSLGDLVAMAREIQELSGITDSEVKIGEADFSGAEG